MAKEAQEAPFRTIAWYQANDAKHKLKATSGDLAKMLQKLSSGSPTDGQTNPVESFVVTEEQAEKKKASAQEKYDAAKEKAGQLEAEAQARRGRRAGGRFPGQGAERSKRRRPLPSGADAKRARLGGLEEAQGGQARQPDGLPDRPGHRSRWCSSASASVAWASRSGSSPWVSCSSSWWPCWRELFAAQANIKAAGVGYAAWAILFGLLISNTIGTPEWVKPAVQTEYFIKTGLVLLGAEILFGKIVAIGIPGIFVAWVVTPIVLVTTYIFGQKSAEDAVEDAQHHDLGRHVGLRRLGGDRHGGGLPRQEGGTHTGRRASRSSSRRS